MSNEKQYNGWTNYETWSYFTWISNEESTSNFYNETAAQFYEDAEPSAPLTKKDVAVYNMADFMKSKVNDENPLLDNSGYYLDILQAGIDSINFDEVAAAFIEAVITATA